MHDRIIIIVRLVFVFLSPPDQRVNDKDHSYFINPPLDSSLFLTLCLRRSAWPVNLADRRKICFAMITIRICVCVTINEGNNIIRARTTTKNPPRVV